MGEALEEMTAEEGLAQVRHRARQEKELRQGGGCFDVLKQQRGSHRANRFYFGDRVETLITRAAHIQSYWAR